MSNVGFQFHGHAQFAVPECGTEAEVTSPDAGLRSEGLPALSLWDLVT